MSNNVIENQWSIIDLPVIFDHRGNLISIEGKTSLPFPIERIYYLFDVPSGSSRGAHAHYNLKQLIIAISGSFQVRLENQAGQQDFFLSRPNKGLLVGPMTWREIDNFSGGAVCLVLASMPYDESDYIRDYSEFLRLAKKHDSLL